MMAQGICSVTGSVAALHLKPLIPLDRLSGLRQLVEKVVDGAEDRGFVGIAFVKR